MRGVEEQTNGETGANRVLEKGLAGAGAAASNARAAHTGRSPGWGPGVAHSHDIHLAGKAGVMTMRNRLEWRMPLALTALAALAMVAVSPGLSRAQSMVGGAGTANANEPAALRTLSVTGFLQDQSGPFIDSEAVEWRKSKNSLATQRSWVQLDINDNPTENDQLFLRLWGVYEPPYPAESLNCVEGAFPIHTIGQHTVPARPTGACNSDFYNDYEVPREFFWKHRQGPLQLFIGRQLVVWGESVAFRATDVVNPVDTSYAFGFANLEDSRTPIWMVHPVLNLPQIGPFAANFVELVYAPGFDYMYNHVDYANDQYDGLDAIAGRVNLGAQNPEGGRFSPRSDPRTLVGPQGSPTGPRGTLASSWPLVRFQDGPVGSTFAPGGPGMYTPNTQPYIKIPNATWGNSQVFIRLHTLVYDNEITAVYAWGHELGSVYQLTNQYAVTVPGHVYQQRINSIFEQYQGAGMTDNKPIYLPGQLSTLPFVIRFEAMYKNHEPYDTLAIPGTYFTNWNTGVGAPDGITYSDTVYWILGLDLDSAYAPWASETGALTMNYEIDGTTILSYSHNMIYNPSLQRIYHNDIGASVNIADSWWWGAIAPTWTMSWNPDGNTWLLFPNITLTPPWTNKYFMNVKWIEIMGTNQAGRDGGAFKGYSMLIFTFQYNFSLI